MAQSQLDPIFWSDLPAPDLIPLQEIGCDPFEQALLPLFRDLAITVFQPEQQSWLPVYVNAQDIWGPHRGLPLVDGLAKILMAILRVTDNDIAIRHGANDRPNGFVTSDEQQVLLMIHHLRRQHPQAASDIMLELTQGVMDHELFAAVETFGQNYSCGAPQARLHDQGQKPALRIVQ